MERIFFFNIAVVTQLQNLPVLTVKTFFISTAGLTWGRWVSRAAGLTWSGSATWEYLDIIGSVNSTHDLNKPLTKEMTTEEADTSL